MSVCVYEKTWPTCSEPLTVGGGVSIGIHLGARAGPVEAIHAGLFPARHPLRLEPFERGLVGNANGMAQVDTLRHNLLMLLVGFDSLNLFPHETFGGVEDRVPRLVGQPGHDAGGHRLDQLLGDDRRSAARPARTGAGVVAADGVRPIRCSAASNAANASTSDGGDSARGAAARPARRRPARRAAARRPATDCRGAGGGSAGVAASCGAGAAGRGGNASGASRCGAGRDGSPIKSGSQSANGSLAARLRAGRRRRAGRAESARGGGRRLRGGRRHRVARRRRSCPR